MALGLGNNLIRNGGAGNPDGLSLDLQFAADKTLTARKGPTPVFTRASTATFVGSNGLIQSAAINAARFDHDPITLECKGLLIEESRTNLLTNSNFVGWASGGSITVTPNSVDVGVAPDGSYPTKIECTVTGNFQLGIPVISGVTYNNSVYARSLSGGVNIRIGGIVSGVVSSFITTNLFARYSHVNTAAATTTRFLLIAMNAGETIYVWGAQAEAGSFPTSYIPTTTGPLTRSADVCSITGSAFSGFYNNSAGTMVAAASANGFTSTNNAIYGVESGTTIVTRVFHRAAQASRLSSQVSATLLTPAANYNSTNVVYKSALAADIDGADYVIDGTQIPDAYTGYVLTADNLKFTGMGGSTSNTTISSFRYYKKRLSVAKLQALTT